MLHSDFEKILDFWFGSLPSAEYYPQEKAAMWFSKNPKVDQHIKQEFEPTLLEADKGSYQDHIKDPKGLLALILLYDQFPRNMYRNSPRAFAWDDKALHLSKKGIQEKQHQALFPVEKTFLYMPLMHSESLEDQDLCIALFDKLVKEHQGSLKKTFQKNLEFAYAHREIIHRFSRFPHRNHVLRRLSSHEEMIFLSGPNSSF